jgi:hypothetical protein
VQLVDKILNPKDSVLSTQPRPLLCYLNFIFAEEKNLVYFFSFFSGKFIFFLQKKIPFDNLEWCTITRCLLKAWTTLEEDYIPTWGPVLKPVQESVLLSSSIKTCFIQLLQFGAGNKKAM